MTALSVNNVIIFYFYNGVPSNVKDIVYELNATYKNYFKREMEHICHFEKLCVKDWHACLCLQIW